MTEEAQTPEDTVPFYPDHVLTEVRVTVYLIVGIIVLGVIGVLLPLGLGPPADPMNTPAHVKPEWYFLALYQLLKFLPKTAGALIPIIAVAFITIWPFIDRKPDISQNSTRRRGIFVIIAMVIIIALTFWGEVS